MTCEAADVAIEQTGLRFADVTLFDRFAAHRAVGVGARNPVVDEDEFVRLGNLASLWGVGPVLM